MDLYVVRDERASAPSLLDLRKSRIEMNKHSDQTERLALYLTTAIASRFEGSIRDHVAACARHMRELQSEIDTLKRECAAQGVHPE